MAESTETLNQAVKVMAGMEGAGIGLAVIHGIVHNAGGSIHVCSESGKRQDI